MGESTWIHFWLFVPISISQCARVLAQGLECDRKAPRGATLPEDAVRQEANRAYNKWLLAWKQRRRA
jgi:hypothetical protein